MVARQKNIKFLPGFRKAISMNKIAELNKVLAEVAARQARLTREDELLRAARLLSLKPYVTKAE